MFSPIRTRAALLALCLFAAPAVGSQLTSPRLHHTAPFLGHTLTLSVDGAQPFASVELYFNTEAGSFPTPFGILELKRSGTLKLATGTTDASGIWSFDLAVPLDPALAETGAHFQAIVADASAPAGKVLTDAFHGRYLGPRFYAMNASGMSIVSAVSDSIVARASYAVTGVQGKPVFDADVTQGAVMSTPRDLLFFDPYFGGVVGAFSFANDCSPILVEDAVGRTTYVLEGSSPPRIHAIDLASRTETGFLDLAYPIATWCAGEPGVDAFVAEYGPNGFEVQHVALDPFADLGSIQVGRASDAAVLALLYSGNSLFVSTADFEFPWTGSLTRCRVTPSGLAADVVTMGYLLLWHMAAVPSLDLAIGDLVFYPPNPPYYPSSRLSQFPMHSVRLRWPTQTPTQPASKECWPNEIIVDGSVAWMAAAVDDPDGVALWRLDLTTWSWTSPPAPMWCNAAKDVELVHDALVEKVAVSNNCMWASPPSTRPTITIVDAAHGTWRKIPLEHVANVMRAVPLP